MLQTQQAIQNLDNVITKIENARLKVSEHHIVHIVAVSKYSQIEDIAKLYSAGQRAFGENKVQDLKQKSHELDDLPLDWHFVGTLQKNKINNLIDLCPSLFHGLDSLELAKQLDAKLEKKESTMNCLLQVNSAKEQSKSGVMPEDTLNIYRQIQDECPRIQLKGLMSIGAHTDDISVIEKSFQVTKTLFDQLQNDGATLLSMGMSGDYELAIANGANMVRIGSALFK